MRNIFKRKVSPQWERNAILMQIYGELNRIRMIMSEGSEIGQRIADFDKQNNGYDPFFDSEVNFLKYKAVKRKK